METVFANLLLWVVLIAGVIALVAWLIVKAARRDRENRARRKGTTQ